MCTDTYTSTNMMLLLLLFIRFLFPGLFVYAKVPPCCSTIQNEKCRAACGQVSTQPSSIPQIQLLLSAAEMCPPDKIDFWQCINESLPAVKMMSSWPGKTCCDLARGKECRRRCNLAETKDLMTKFCREIAEPSLFECIQRQEAGSQCCNKTATSCGIVCRGVYVTGGGSTRATRIVLSQHCSLTDKHVEHCVHKQWHPQEGNSLRSLPCCEKAQNPLCRSTCRNVLQTVMSEDDRVDELISACSQPQPTDPLWQCFLNNPNTRKNETTPMSRIDNAKLQCCGKASSSRCRELCAQTYKGGWSYHAEFESTCSYMQPVSTVESNLHNCLTDVDQACQLGCSGLSFCTNFNNRPTELFRSCTVEADQAAQMVFNSWKNGVIHLPQMTIPVKDISQCKPAMWKAIACALEIKPCGSQQSLMTLCKEDCLFILTKCVDASSLSGDKTVPVLCNALPSKNEAGSCVSLDSYLYESPHASKVADVKHPCNPNPCLIDEVCLVRRWKCKHADHCLPYVCHKACPLGQVSKVLVPRGTDVRLINLNETPNEEDCYLACHCGSRGLIENCKPLICLRRDSCFLGHGNTKEHGQHFSVNGNACVCNAGRLLCTRKSCQPDNHSFLSAGNPSNCPTDYNPVCGSNGKTYPNQCMARCAGISNQISASACSDVDVCSQRPCPAGFKCVPYHHVCLNDMPGSHSCPQFQCVDETCTSHGHDPVCSSSGDEFSNICQMFSHRKFLEYWGHCQSSCSDTGVVCGQDGETYKSKCAALAARVSVDYFSKCQAFGNLSGDSGRTPSCSRVKCPPMLPVGCQGVVPPGACCPVCAAQIRLLWDSRLMAAAAAHTKHKVISVVDVLNRLSEHISMLQCDVSGYVSVIGELIVIVGSVVTQPTALQVEACQSEARRIHSLLKMGSPNLVSYLTVSPIVFSELELSSMSATLMDSMYKSDLFRGSHSSENRSCSQVTNVLLLTLCAVFALMCCLIQRVRLKL